MKKIQLTFNKKIAVLLLSFVITGLIASLGLYIFLRLKPETTEKSVVSNVITTSLEYKLTADMKKSTLYPDGGAIDVDKVLMTEITDDAFMSVLYKVESEEAIQLKGSISLSLELLSRERWNNERIILESKDISAMTTGAVLIDETFNIELKEIDKFIEKVEEETKTAASEYVIVINPIIEGSATFDGDIKTLDSGLPCELTYQSKIIELPDVYTYEETQRYLETVVEANRTSYLGSTDLTIARKRGVMIVSFFVLSLIGLIVISIKKKVFTKSITERVNRKFKNDLLLIDKDIDKNAYHVIEVDDYNSFHKIATRRDVEILHYEAKSENKYFIIEDNQLYIYKTAK